MKGSIALLAVATLAISAAAQTPFSSSQYWPPAAQPQQVEFETILNAVPSRTGLRAYHEQFASEPHIAGTPGDERTIQRIAGGFRMLGLDVKIHEFWAYLTTPIDAAVEIISPDPIQLSIKEEAVPDDRFAGHSALTIGFNAYSADGDVTAEIVYANYGTKDDFAKLREVGVDCTGKIVLARYGGNFRGYKAKFAQQAGAAGLIIYTDPEDSGYRKGVPYPEGGWANETAIQRGSLNTLDYPGDPLTPFKPATEHGERLNPQDVNLPRIPVQPIGYGAAREIMLRMKGRPLPQELVKSWQGGMPCAYRLEGGAELRVRLMVKQERKVTKTANITGTLWGTEFPEQRIIIGCHHDAWGHGAGDPLAGTILLLESARSFQEARHRGFEPARTIVFAAWGAEEYGIIGSTEFCEQFGESLLSNAVAYINLDAAAMGPNFSASASPSLKKIIEQATQDVPQARDADRTIHSIWLGDRDQPDFGNLGGGSDHVGFYCHLGIPSCGMNAGGSLGTAYHSNYDHVQWYQKFVGDDYEPAIMLTRVLNLVASRLAEARLLPLDPVQYASDTRSHLKAIQERAKQVDVELDTSSLLERIDQYEEASRRVMQEAHARLAQDTLDDEALAAINVELLRLERDWLRPKVDGVGVQAGIGRAWFRNLFAASDPDSGYAAWMLPLIREKIESRDVVAAALALGTYRSVFDSLETRMQRIEAALRRPPKVESEP